VNPPVSLYILAYNEKPQLAELLPTVKWADDVMVLDSYSTDGTAELCRDFAVRHLNEEFQGFGALRNRAIELAAHDWVVSIDSDERCTPEFAAEVRQQLVNPSAEAFLVPRMNFFLGRPVWHGGMYPDYRQPQVFNRRCFRYCEDLVHEGWECNGRIGRFRNPVHQTPFASVAVAMRKADRYTTLMAQRYFSQGTRATWRHLSVHPFLGFCRKFLVQQGFRDGKRGFLLAALHGYYCFFKYIKLWEIEEQSRARKAVGAGHS
jgi:glycosyltransferase involved in cell wall biosynthesis